MSHLCQLVYNNVQCLLILMLHACVNAHGGQFEHFLLKLSSFVSVSDIIL